MCLRWLFHPSLECVHRSPFVPGRLPFSARGDRTGRRRGHQFLQRPKASRETKSRARGQEWKVKDVAPVKLLCVAEEKDFMIRAATLYDHPTRKGGAKDMGGRAPRVACMGSRCASRYYMQIAWFIAMDGWYSFTTKVCANFNPRTKEVGAWVSWEHCMAAVVWAAVFGNSVTYS